MKLQWILETHEDNVKHVYNNHSYIIFNNNGRLSIFEQEFADIKTKKAFKEYTDFAWERFKIDLKKNKDG